MDQRVRMKSGAPPRWRDVAALLAAKGCPTKLMMIDGQLAFPDELPDDGWKELRVGFDSGMVTLSYEGDCVRLAIWGNADLNLRRAWNALTWAIAEASGGDVITAAGILSRADFLRTAELPPQRSN